MSIRVSLNHSTKYVYDKPAKVFPQVLRLRPAPHTRTPIVSYSLNIYPKDHFINWHQDPFGNYNAKIVFQDLVKVFEIDVQLVLDLVPFNPFDFFLDEYAEQYPFDYEDQLKRELAPYLEYEALGLEMNKLRDQILAFGHRGTVDFLVEVNSLVKSRVDYIIRLEPGVQDCEVTLTKALGSCRDSAWVLVQLFRSVGLAARFVSGYLVQLKPDEMVVDGPNGPEQDFTDLHAWAEVYVPGAGWIGLDATSGLLAGEGHIPLACAADYQSAAPISGFTEKVNSKMEYLNSVKRIEDHSRVTKPYRSEQIEAIHALGTLVDERLENSDVRLTMGGEPTFVSTEDMESKQWNDEADGDEKRKIGFELVQLLSSSYAKGGLLHCGQGKWYPGEPIPRWQYALMWRKDGEPIWQNSDLLADPNSHGVASHEDVDSFSRILASKLGLSQDYIHEAYEDMYYYQWERGNLPIGVTLNDIDKEDTGARKKLAELEEGNMNSPVGTVLPLLWDHNAHGWKSSKWVFNRSKLFVIPGDSSLGYRLPLDRIRSADDSEDIVVPTSPFEDQAGLPSKKDLTMRLEVNSSKISSPQSMVKTAVCVELVNGHLTIFLPPLEEIEPFLLLVTAIESAAQDTDTPIVLRGYQAPYDGRIEKLAVTPDPGVLEINIHPSQSWEEIRTKYDILFDCAHKVKLGTQKFMLDGRHSGTGGGNHITLGGVKPAESPLLRRPGLLRSMIAFWVNHPSLSYLFSSPFVGMTSQAPRVDEGKPDAIYNLSIAFKELDKYDNPPFWVVDRLFRNILTDITGNTHRSEFCIDKLYSPDSQTGRLGILELRGFDMPPHKDMVMVQLLLIRSLVAAFWDQPYREKLTNWGSVLHDKFMIEHYVKKDMETVVTYLRNSGIPFDAEWLIVFYEFKFPVLGSVDIDEIQIELRAGIEPWNVLGEEMSSSGTARFVDSSMERIQVKVRGFNADRYQLLCNHVVIKLNATTQPQEYVAGIRYKAWAPPSAMHPTHGVDTPLVFDVYDTWNKVSIGGCTYHVMHPGGRSYETFPVNAFEAEGRRHTRFSEENKSPRNNVTIRDQGDEGQYTYQILSHGAQVIDSTPVVADDNNTYPFTLDLQSV